MAKKTLKDAQAMGLIPKAEAKEVKTVASISRVHLQELIEFAKEHHFVITPVGCGYYVASFNKFQCCPCAPERKSCPCDESEKEILTLGKCKCQLFWRDYETYLAAKFK